MMDDRSGFDDFYEPPTREFIRNSLMYGLTPTSSVDSPMTKLTQRLIRALYKRKSQIVRIPILGRVALFIATKISERKLSQMASKPSQLDLSPIMSLETDEFIKQLYLQVLGRPADPAGLESYRQALLTGATREAIAYLFCSSAEFGNRTRVVHLDRYEQEYRRYRRHQWLRRIPVVSSVLAIKDDNRLIKDELEKTKEELMMIKAGVSALDAKTEFLSSHFQESFSSLLAVTESNRPAYYSFPNGVTVVRMKEYIFGVPSEEWRLAVFLNSYGFFEYGTEKYFRSILREGMNVLDIGANLGIYTLHALAAGCFVYSYEPTPNIYNILLDNIGINGFEPSGRAQAYNLAVSNIEGEVEFAVYPNINGHNSFYAVKDNDQRIKVRTICLDHHLRHLTHVDVVKIDVEGAEPLVLQGMQEIIAKNPAIKIIMEFGPTNLKRGGHDPLAFLSDIHAMGLNILKISEETGELYSTNDTDLCADYSSNVLLAKSP